jgi:L,D-peptidoglycan transpeptidase YkuD (ErfK/YbiS/YcfS/YnhG family)
VESQAFSSTRASLKMLEYSQQQSTWNKIEEIQTVIGKNGLTKDKCEGDRKTPIGLFRIGTGFGTHAAPDSCHWPYRLTSQNDFWVDDPDSADYNQWVRYEGDPHKRWKSFERLAIPAYAYAAVIEYNVYPVIPGKGSAIFLHVWQGPESPTAGCVAMSEEDMKRLLQWLSPEHNPHIAIGTQHELTQIIPFAQTNHTTRGN